jgi:chromosome segregation ATPase
MGRKLEEKQGRIDGLSVELEAAHDSLRGLRTHLDAGYQHTSGLEDEIKELKTSLSLARTRAERSADEVRTAVYLRPRRVWFGLHCYTAVFVCCAPSSEP